MKQEILKLVPWAKLKARCYKRKYYKSQVEDLEQAACLGLCDAAKRYIPGGVASFKTFAYWYVRDSIHAQGRLDSSPLNIKSTTYKESYKTNFERLDLNTALKTHSSFFSKHIDTMVEDKDQVSAEERLILKDLVAKSLAILKPQEQELVYDRFYNEMPYKELSKKHKRSENNLKNRMSRLLKRIQPYMREQGLKEAV